MHAFASTLLLNSALYDNSHRSQTVRRSIEKMRRIRHQRRSKWFLCCIQQDRYGEAGTQEVDLLVCFERPPSDNWSISFGLNSLSALNENYLTLQFTGEASFESITVASKATVCFPFGQRHMFQNFPGGASSNPTGGYQAIIGPNFSGN